MNKAVHTKKTIRLVTENATRDAICNIIEIASINVCWIKVLLTTEPAIRNSTRSAIDQVLNDE